MKCVPEAHGAVGLAFLGGLAVASLGWGGLLALCLRVFLKEEPGEGREA